MACAPTYVLGIAISQTHNGNGSNAVTTNDWIYEHLFKPWAGSLNGSLSFAIATVCFWWLILYFMYGRS